MLFERCVFIGVYFHLADIHVCPTYIHIFSYFAHKCGSSANTNIFTTWISFDVFVPEHDHYRFNYVNYTQELYHEFVFSIYWMTAHESSLHYKQDKYELDLSFCICFRLKKHFVNIILDIFIHLGFTNRAYCSTSPYIHKPPI